MPVYLATAIAAAHGVTMILTAIAMASPLDVGGIFGFSSRSVIREFHLWQFLTYAFVNPPGFFAAFQLVMLAMFGAEVEKFIGRKSFAWLYGLLILAGPVLLLVLNFCGVAANESLIGSTFANTAVFLAFALIYPRAEIFFTIQARWIMAAGLGILTLQLMAAHEWFLLSLLWWECVVAALWLVIEGVHTLPLPSWGEFRRERHSKKKLRVVPRPSPSESSESIDPILEKIARQGLGSLTRAERDQLERARTALLEKERTG